MPPTGIPWIQHKVLLLCKSRHLGRGTGTRSVWDRDLVRPAQGARERCLLCTESFTLGSVTRWNTVQFPLYFKMCFLNINMCRHLIPLEFSKSPLVLRDRARGGALAPRDVPGLDQ